jgi:hypothetical protein
VASICHLLPTPRRGSTAVLTSIFGPDRKERGCNCTVSIGFFLKNRTDQIELDPRGLVRTAERSDRGPKKKKRKAVRKAELKSKLVKAGSRQYVCAAGAAKCKRRSALAAALPPHPHLARPAGLGYPDGARGPGGAGPVGLAAAAGEGGGLRFCGGGVGGGGAAIAPVF